MSNNMKVIYIKGETPEIFDVHGNSIKELLSIISISKGDEFIAEIVENNYKFILANSSTLDDKDSYVPLMPEVLFTEFTGYDTLFIIADIEGNEPISITVTAAAAMGLTGAAATAAAWAMTAVIMMAVSMGMSMLMSAISPTPEFSKDPAATQNKSNLFNGAPIIRDQGGSVPLIFGNPYAGAVLISSGAFTEEVAV